MTPGMTAPLGRDEAAAVDARCAVYAELIRRAGGRGKPDTDAYFLRSLPICWHSLRLKDQPTSEGRST